MQAVGKKMKALQFNANSDLEEIATMQNNKKGAPIGCAKKKRISKNKQH